MDPRSGDRMAWVAGGLLGEACSHRERPAFDGWFAVVQQVLGSRIFEGGDSII